MNRVCGAPVPRHVVAQGGPSPADAAAGASPLAAARASRAEVRNPVLGLSAFQRLAALDPDVLRALGELLDEIHRDAACRAEYSWKTRKAPMAAYWRAVSVYAGHVARALRRAMRSGQHQLELIRDAA